MSIPSRRVGPLMSRQYREPRDWSYYAGREETQAQQQTKYEDDADSRRKGENQ